MGLRLCQPLVGHSYNLWATLILGHPIGRRDCKSTVMSLSRCSNPSTGSNAWSHEMASLAYVFAITKESSFVLFSLRYRGNFLDFWKFPLYQISTWTWNVPCPISSDHFQYSPLLSTVNVMHHVPIPATPNSPKWSLLLSFPGRLQHHPLDSSLLPSLYSFVDCSMVFL